jgi:hypothetical protein
MPLVVCSRKAEYEAASTRERLLLQNAVIVQALTQEQVEKVISQGGSELAALHEALINNPTVRELATTPLMLSVLILAYRGTTVSVLPLQQAQLEERIWTDYVERMARQKGADRQDRADLPMKLYPLAETCSWLSWLAQQMRSRNLTVFYGEQLQESWIPTSRQWAVRWLGKYLLAMLLGALSTILLFLLLFGSTDLPTIYQMGLVGGFLGLCLHKEQTASASGSSRQTWGKRGCYGQGAYVLRAGVLAILYSACFGLKVNGQYYFASEWVIDALIYGVLFLVSAWLFQFRLIRDQRRLAPAPPRRLLLVWLSQAMPLLRTMWAGVILAIGLALSDGLLTGLSQGQPNWFSFGLSEGLSTAMIDMLSYGLVFGVSLYLVTLILHTQMGKVQLVEQVQWTWRGFFRLHHVRTSLTVVLATLCFVGLIVGLSNWLLTVGTDVMSYIIVRWQGFSIDHTLSEGLTIGLRTGLSSGLDFGLNIGLNYWILLGLHQGLTRTHLEEQNRFHFNQGLHRSLRNGLFLSVLSAGIITGIGVMISHLNIDLYYWLSDWLKLGQSTQIDMLATHEVDVWLLFPCSWLVVWATNGGLTIMRHYTMRLLLAHTHTFPLHAQRFLDDATARVLLRRVGGGYSFVHRRLLDYFASLEKKEA